MSDAHPLSKTDPWNLVADGYCEATVPMLREFSKEALKEVTLTPSMSVLDLACGPGTTTMLLADKVAHVTALDFSPSMMAHLQRELQKTKIKNVTAITGDGQRTSLLDASFDVVISMFGLMFFPDKHQAFREVTRLLKPNGRALIASWAPMERSTLMQVIGGALAASQSTPTRRAGELGMLDTKEQYKSFLAGSGLQLEAWREVTLSFPSATAEDFWKRTERGTAPIAMMKEAMGAEEWQKVRVAAVAYLRTHHRFPTGFATTAYLAVLSAY